MQHRMQEQLKAHQQVQQVRLQQEQRLLGTEQTTAGAFLIDLYIGVNYCNLLSVCFNHVLLVSRERYVEPGTKCGRTEH